MLHGVYLSDMRQHRIKQTHEGITYEVSNQECGYNVTLLRIR